MRPMWYVSILFAALVSPLLAMAETGARGDPIVPNFWDPTHREERPDLSGQGTIRVLTEAENPPFSFIGADGLPTGFHVELARAICLELDMPCTVQTLRWDLLLDGLEDNRGDAIVSSMAIDAEARERFRFSRTYLSRPARFAVRRDAEDFEVLPEEMAGRTVAVASGTAHEAYVEAFFPEVEIRAFNAAREARSALMEGEVDALFGDGLNLSLWLNGAVSRRCCTFRGGAFTESRYFGEGFAIAVSHDDNILRRAFDHALARLQSDGTYAELYQKYFPVSFY